MSNVVLTAYSVKNEQKATIANDISGEAQSVLISRIVALSRIMQLLSFPDFGVSPQLCFPSGKLDDL